MAQPNKYKGCFDQKKALILLTSDWLKNETRTAVPRILADGRPTTVNQETPKWFAPPAKHCDSERPKIRSNPECLQAFKGDPGTSYAWLSNSSAPLSPRYLFHLPWCSENVSKAGSEAVSSLGITNHHEPWSLATIINHDSSTMIHQPCLINQHLTTIYPSFTHPSPSARRVAPGPWPTWAPPSAPKTVLRSWPRTSAEVYGFTMVLMVFMVLHGFTWFHYNFTMVVLWFYYGCTLLTIVLLRFGCHTQFCFGYERSVTIV